MAIQWFTGDKQQKQKRKRSKRKKSSKHTLSHTLLNTYFLSYSLGKLPFQPKPQWSSLFIRLHTLLQSHNQPLCRKHGFLNKTPIISAKAAGRYTQSLALPKIGSEQTKQRLSACLCLFVWYAIVLCEVFSTQCTRLLSKAIVCLSSVLASEANPNQNRCTSVYLTLLLRLLASKKCH